MIQLYQFSPMQGLPSLSPFCLKLETWLRMAGLSYECVYTNDPRVAPQGKLPAIRTDNRMIPDSELCIAYLAKKHGIDLDAGLDARQKAAAHALRILLEDHLYWAMIYSRFIDERYWPKHNQTLFGQLPMPVRMVLPGVIRQKIRRDLQGHGLGRHSQEQIYAFAAADIAAVAALLGEQDYMMGDQPSQVDATAYAFLAQLTLISHNSPWPALVAPYPALRAYCQRMQQRYFP